MNPLYHKAHFLISASTFSQAPPDEGLEVAFAGRANAGKSSAINLLSNQKQLARVSKTPGRTQLLNFFDLDGIRRLVDLPGYGYARVAESVTSRASMRATICSRASRKRLSVASGFCARATECGIACTVHASKAWNR